MNYNFVSQYRKFWEVNYKFLSQCWETFEVNNNLLPLCGLFRVQSHSFISQCRNICQVNYDFASQSWKFLIGELQFCLTVSKILWDELQFCLKVPKVLRRALHSCLAVSENYGVNKVLVLLCRKCFEVNYNFVSHCGYFVRRITGLSHSPKTF